MAVSAALPVDSARWTRRIRWPLLGLVVLAVLAVLGSWRLHAVFASLRGMTESRAAVTELMIHLRDAETGQRGFLITGDPAYLEPFLAGSAETRARLAAGLVPAGIGPLTEQASRLAALAETKLEELSLTIEVARRDGLEPARALVRQGRGKALMDAARDASAQMEADLSGRVRRLQARLWWEGLTGLVLLLAGLATCVAGFGTEQTRRRRADVATGAQRDLLVNELRHRVKNSLAVAHSLANQSWATLEEAGRLDEFNAVFGERLRALGRAHDLVANADWRPTPAGEICRSALAPWILGGQVEITDAAGAALVAPEAAVSLMLVLHELATNATKYGALSLPSGRVHVALAARPREVELNWAERGGPPVMGPPHREGFGSMLIAGSGDAQLAWRAEGLAARITLPRGEA